MACWWMNGIPVELKGRKVLLLCSNSGDILYVYVYVQGEEDA
jgi:hypothetical protein